MPTKNIQVVVRCRPMNSQERSKGAVASVECLADRVTVKERNAPMAATKTFTFDRVFGPLSKQNELYRAIVKPVVEEVLEGYNCTVFAYGQTGTGKTFTMVGERSDELRYTWQDDPLAGIIPRSLSHLFDCLETNGCEFSMRVSFLELYNEELFDLLAAGEDHNRLRIFDDASRKGSVVVQGLEEVAVSNKDAVYEIIQRGMQRRATAATLLNAQSSRSHSVFTVTVHMRENSVDGEEMLKIGKLNLVDLAGSENIGRSGALEKRAREAGSINQSLLTLGRVITALVERTPHIPYRESKLTRILQDSLGGRTKTSIIATISPGSINLEETISTLDYAHRAKNIQNRPEVNQKLCKKALLKEYSDEVERLRRDLLATREKNGCFMDLANYQRMQTTMQQQRDRITEQETALAGQRQELEKLADVLQLTEEELEALRTLNSDLEADLTKTRRQAAAIQQRLVETEIARREEADLKDAHRETEARLTDEAGRLMTAADASVDDVSALHDKVDRMKSSESGAKTVAGRLAESVSHQCGDTQQRVDILRDGLLQAADVASTELAQLAEEASSRGVELEAVVRRHAGRLDAGLGEVRAAVLQLVEEGRERAARDGGRLRELQESLAAQSRAVGDEVEAQAFPRLRDASSRLAGDLDRAESAAERQSSQAAAGMADIEEQHGALLRELAGLIATSEEKHARRHEALRQQFEASLAAAEAERKADVGEAVALLQRLSRSFEAAISGRRAQEAEAAASTRTTISEAKASCGSLAEELPASEAAVMARIRESRGALQCEVAGLEAEAAAWTEEVAGKAREVRERMQQRLGDLGGDVRAEVTQRCEDAARQAGRSVSRLQALVEENAATARQQALEIRGQMEGLEESVVRVLTSEMPPCPATGTTPARREYSYPRQLSRTSPVSRLAKFRDRLDRAEVEAVCRIEEETDDDGKRRHSSGILSGDSARSSFSASVSAGSVCTQSSSRPTSPGVENEIPKEPPVGPVPTIPTTKTVAATAAATTMKPVAVKKSKRPFQNRN